MRGDRFIDSRYDVVSNIYIYIPLFWLEKSGCYKKLYGVELVQVTMGKVRTIKDRKKVAQDRQKKYADVRRRHLKFIVGGPSILEGSPVEKHVMIQIEREASFSLHRTFQNPAANWASSLQSRLAPTVNQGS